MAIYGTALLSICLLAGLLAGQLLGVLMGIDKNVGGVGIAMLLLILACDRLRVSGGLQPATQGGTTYWSAVYIPIVVAMAASQDVLSALRGGPAAVVAGVLAVVACFAMVPVISRLGVADSTAPESGKDEPR